MHAFGCDIRLACICMSTHGNAMRLHEGCTGRPAAGDKASTIAVLVVAKHGACRYRLQAGTASQVKPETCQLLLPNRWWASGANKERATVSACGPKRPAAPVQAAAFFAACCAGQDTAVPAHPCWRCVRRSPRAAWRPRLRHMCVLGCTAHCWTQYKTQAGMRGLCLRPWTLLLLPGGAPVALQSSGHAVPTQTTGIRRPPGPCC